MLRFHFFTAKQGTSVHKDDRGPLHGKIPMGSPLAAHSVAHVQPTGSEVGSSPVFSVWESTVDYIIL